MADAQQVTAWDEKGIPIPQKASVMAWDEKGVPISSATSPVPNIPGLPSPVAQAQQVIKGTVKNDEILSLQGKVKGIGLAPPFLGLIGSSLIGGGQVVDQELREGAPLKEAATSGALTAATSFGLGKALPFLAGKYQKAIPSRINKILGIQPKQIRVGLGQASETAGTNPGRTLAEEISPTRLKMMSPDSRSKFIGTLRDKAGQEVDSVIARTTKLGTKVNPTSQVRTVFDRTADPSLQRKALDAIDATAKDIGITDVTRMNPAEARQLRDALKTSANFDKPEFNSMPALRAKLSNAIGNAMNDQIPGLSPVNQRYADLNQAAIGAKRGVQQKVAGSTSSTARKIAVGAATGAGAGYFGKQTIDYLKDTF